MQGDMPREFAYRKVRRYLEALIGQALAAGTCRLPSLRTLSSRLQVSLATVQHAYNLLEEEGRVQCLPRSGYFVHSGPSQLPAITPGHPPLPLRPVLQGSLLNHERRLARQKASTSGPWADPASARLRLVLAERYTRSCSRYWRAGDVQLAPDVTALLDTLLKALALEGATVLVQSPCCRQVLRALTNAGLRVLEVPVDGRGSPNLRALAGLLDSEPVGMVVMPSCLGMPQGRLVAAACQQQIGHLLSQHPLWVLENDLDSDLCHAGPPTTRLRDWVEPRWLLVLGGFEAALGPEVPYAYVLGPAEVLEQAFIERAYRLAPLRLLALACMLGKGEVDAQWLQVRTGLLRRAQTLSRMLELQFGPSAAVHPPQGGLLLWVRLRRAPQWGRVMAAVAGSELYAMPGVEFSLQGRYRHYLALGWLGDDPVELQAAVERLARAADSR